MSILRCFGPCASTKSTFFKNVPLEWSIREIGPPLTLIFVTISLLEALIGFFSLATGSPFLYTLAKCIGSVISCFGCISCLLLKKAQWYRGFEVCMVLTVVALSMCSSYSALATEDSTLRHQTLIASATMWKPVLSMLGGRIHSVVALIVLTAVHDLVVLWLSNQVFDEPTNVPMFLNVYVWSLVFVSFGVSANHRIVKLHAAQDIVAEEKEILDALLTMVCDCKVWLADDANTVVRSDPSFHGLVGRNPEGYLLTSFMDSLEASRFNQVCRRLLTDAHRQRVLPVTLTCPRGRQVLEFFLVDRRRPHSRMQASERKGAFLVGVRTTGPLEPADSSSSVQLWEWNESDETSEFDSHVPPLSTVLLKTVDNVIVHFDGLSDNLAVRSLEVAFSPGQQSEWSPQLQHFLLEPWSDLFTQTCQKIINEAAYGEPGHLPKAVSCGPVSMHVGSGDLMLSVDAVDLMLDNSCAFEAQNEYAPMSVQFCNIRVLNLRSAERAQLRSIMDGCETFQHQLSTATGASAMGNASSLTRSVRL